MVTKEFGQKSLKSSSLILDEKLQKALTRLEKDMCNLCHNYPCGNDYSPGDCVCQIATVRKSLDKLKTAFSRKNEHDQAVRQVFTEELTVIKNEKLLDSMEAPSPFASYRPEDILRQVEEEAAKLEKKLK